MYPAVIYVSYKRPIHPQRCVGARSRPCPTAGGERSRAIASNASRPARGPAANPRARDERRRATRAAVNRLGRRVACGGCCRAVRCAVGRDCKGPGARRRRATQGPQGASAASDRGPQRAPRVERPGACGLGAGQHKNVRRRQSLESSNIKGERVPRATEARSEPPESSGRGLAGRAWDGIKESVRNRSGIV